MSVCPHCHEYLESSDLLDDESTPELLPVDHYGYCDDCGSKTGHSAGGICVECGSPEGFFDEDDD